MQISIQKKFSVLLATFAITISSAIQLTAMRYEPLVPLDAWKICSRITKKLLLPELTPHIFYYYTVTQWADYVAESCTRPEMLVRGIDMLNKNFPYFNHTILTLALNQAHISICDFVTTFLGNYTTLQIAARKHKKEVVALLLTLPNAQMLTVKRDSNGWTALHEVLEDKDMDTGDIVTLLLNAAGNKAWKMISKPVKNGRTAWGMASPEIRLIMERYRPDANEENEESSTEEGNNVPTSCVVM